MEQAAEDSAIGVADISANLPTSQPSDGDITTHEQTGSTWRQVISEEGSPMPQEDPLGAVDISAYPSSSKPSKGEVHNVSPHAGQTYCELTPNHVPARSASSML